MSVDYNKFLGYRIDITEEFRNLEEKNEKINDELLFDRKPLSEGLKDLGYIPYFHHQDPKKGDITIIDDGMNGNYTYLILIQSANYNYSYYDENDNVDEDVNEFLSTISIPDEVINRLNQAYELIFGAKNEKEIECKVFVHVD